MHPVAIFDLVSFLAALTALIVLLGGWRRALKGDTKLLLAGLFTFMLFYSFCLFLEWSGISKAFDAIENFIGALIPMWWAFVFYAFLKEIASHDLQQSETKYRLLVDHQNDLIVKFNLDKQLVFVSPSYCKTFGKTEQELLGQQFLPFIHEDDRQSISNSLEKALVPPYSTYHEERVYANTGLRWLAWKANGVLSESGEVESIIAVGRDITEQKKTEQALVESEERFSLFMDYLPAVVFIKDAEGRALYVNKHMNDVLGAKDWIGKTALELFPKEPAKKMVADDKKTLSERYRMIIERVPDRDGVEHIYQTHKFRIDRHSDPPFLGGISMDITERIHAEEALRESEEKMRLIIESSPIGIGITQGGKYVYVNPKFVEIFGYDCPDEIVEQPINFLYAPEDKDLIVQRHWDRLAGKEIPSSYEVMGQKKSGQLFNVALWNTIIDYEGETAVLGFITDTSEAQALRAQLQRAEKMEAVGMLAGGVAHDLNNVLSGLVSYPDLLLMDLPDDSPLRNAVATIADSGKKAAAIVQDLLTLARRGVAVTKVVNVNDVICDYLASPEYKKLKTFYPNAQFNNDLQEDLLNVLGSPVHLSKTIMNLVSNAAESLLGDGIVTISTKNQYVDRPIRGYDEVKEGDYVVLRVADNGIGIAADDLEKIFEPFYTKKMMGRSGTGLGMAVVWGTVKDHNGYIDVESTEGKGTIFELYFPVDRMKAEKEKPALFDEYAGKGESILVVDDVAQQRDIASVLLTKLGYSVDVVASGEEAVEYMKANSTDLLILDMIMAPGIDGLDTYKRIIKLHPGQKAIITSGFSETDRVKEAQRLGAGQYIKKPYTLEKIGLAVKSELDR
jgi:PAS domain S-box-containing protein